MQQRRAGATSVATTVAPTAAIIAETRLPFAPMDPSTFPTRVKFICELARRLHQYGTSAPRLETALDSVSRKLGLLTQIWSNPTGILISFADAGDDADPLAQVTQVIRLDPGETSLKRLSEVDAIAERVYTGEIGIAEGYAKLRALRSGFRPRVERVLAACQGVAAAIVVVLLKGGWAEVALSLALGGLIGALGLFTARRPQIAAGFEAIAAMLAAFLAVVFSHFVTPIAVNSVLIASVIVLLPGLALTTAVTELASQHLSSGTARLAGAGAVLLKLGFGAAAGFELAKLCGLAAGPGVPSGVLPPWAEWLALLIGSFNFALLFKAAPRDFPLVMVSSILGYLVTRYAGVVLGSEFGVFVAGLVVGLLSNLYARHFNRPGALVRVPGIIMLVPGSVGLRSLFFVFQHDVYQGLDTVFSLVVLLISLVAGLLFGNVLIAPRRSLS